jgi:acyl carrier protein
MALPQGVIDFLNENAKQQGAALPGPDEDLFVDGVLDSFTLVDFITVLEENCGIKVPDSDVNPANFQSISAIERYIEAHKG